MFRHVVLLTFTPETTESQAEAIAAELRALPAAIPELVNYTIGIDAGLAEGNATLCAVADFDDVAGWKLYAEHPAHVKVLEEMIRPALANRTAVQHPM